MFNHNKQQKHDLLSGYVDLGSSFLVCLIVSGVSKNCIQSSSFPADD